MRLLAQTRADVRRAVPDRLMLAHPDTRGTMPGWKKDDRVPNTLRFKVRQLDDGFVAVTFHVPCHAANELWSKLGPGKQRDLITCFEKAHVFMDCQQAFERSEA
jgi:hypothetical protein